MFLSKLQVHPKKRNIYIYQSSLYFHPKTVTERKVIIRIYLRITSNPKCTEEETVGAVWNSGAIMKGGGLHTDDIDRESIHAQVQVLRSEEEQNEQLELRREKKIDKKKDSTPLHYAEQM